MKDTAKRIGAGAATLAMALVFLSLAHPRAAFPDSDDEDQAVISPDRVRVVNGETVIVLSQKTQARMGLQVAPLEEVSAREPVTAIALVLPVDELVALRQSVVAAQTSIEKARVALDVSRKEFARVKALYQEDQNASQKDFEATQAAVQADQADLDAAEQQRSLAESAARARWGGVIARWIAGGSPLLERVFRQEELLVQIALPSGMAAAAKTALLEVPGAKTARARLLSPFPRTDPRILGASFLYITRARPGLAPGMSVTARFAVGRRRKGTRLPRRAEVWWQGKPWIYVQTAPDRFTRRAVPAAGTGKEAGGLISGFAPGTRVVVTGAIMLLSEEFRAKVAAAEED